MPIYEYRCSACAHKLEALQKITEAPLTECPVCGKKSLAKLVSAAGFQLKGSGWYATDFKGSGRKPEAGAGTGKNGETVSAESKSEAKTESKTDSTAAASTAGCGAKCSCH